jgi:hypothetical protein
MILDFEILEIFLFFMEMFRNMKEWVEEAGLVYFYEPFEF